MAYGRATYSYSSDLVPAVTFGVNVSRNTGAITGQGVVAAVPQLKLKVSNQGRKQGLQARRLNLRRVLVAATATTPAVYAFASPVIFTKAAFDTLIATTTLDYAGKTWDVIGGDPEEAR